MRAATSTLRHVLGLIFDIFAVMGFMAISIAHT
jgi:hypothetical protein